jgi:hypothetical protein
MDPKTKNDSLKFGYYFVALIDVLTQKEALQEFNKLPQTEDEKTKFIQAAKKTFGVVDGIRGLFDEFFTAYQKAENLDQNLPAEMQHLFDKMRTVQVNSQRFMDTIIIYVPLADSVNSSPLTGIYSALLACGSTFLCSLAAKHALRGGLEIGLGAELTDGEIYGPVVYEAYRLESSVADYPRIVAGQELLKYLFHKRDVVDSALLARFTSQMAETCLRFLVQDIDGHATLDYLGREFMERGEYLLIKDGVHLKAYDFIIEQASRWKARKDTKLSFRYSLLQKYFDARLSMLAKNKES